MPNITEIAQWEAAIREIATTDPVVGGATGPANVQAQQLANRTVYLKNQIAQLLASGGGTSSAALSAHIAATDPHPQYVGGDKFWDGSHCLCDISCRWHYTACNPSRNGCRFG